MPKGSGIHHTDEKYKRAICALCKQQARRRYADKLCGKCYLKKKRGERQVRAKMVAQQPNSEPKMWF
jgi:hypothetical protein